MIIFEKALHSVWKVCIIQKNPCILFGSGEHEVRRSAAFWLLVFNMFTPLQRFGDFGVLGGSKACFEVLAFGRG